ncbi:hypothetical protein PybrP1_004513 [[Pythium] brassicae (nom. inval.)]|nr:hypothetical protein PybrP1_004513 [[Pythium] brassicae (nom. inval.)]
MRQLLLPTLLLLLSTLAPPPTRAGCCDVCLAQTDPAHTEITYDPLVHDQCSPVKGICCYGCGFAHGAVSFQEGVSFDAATGAAVAKAGTRIRFSFSGVARVTYDLLRTNQKKTSFVGNRSTSADHDADGVFSICVTSGGSIALRGWGTDSCTQATTETAVRVDAVDGAKCSAPAASSTPAPAPTTKPTQSVDTLTDPTAPQSGKFDVANCNLNRGTVVTGGDGVKTCECAGDWSNPPACDGYSWTKTILTIAGAVATVLSIALSVRVYVKSRKEKAEARRLADELDLDDRVSENALRVDRRSPGKLPTPTTGGKLSGSPVPTPGASRSPGEVQAVRETTL